MEEEFILLRQELDWSWHVKETTEDLVKHNEFIFQMLSAQPLRSVSNPVIVCMGGCYGCGKSHVIKRWKKEATEPNDGEGKLSNVVLVDVMNSILNDPDDIKHRYGQLYSNAECSHKEACLMSELLTRYCLHHNYNIIVDGSLQDSTWQILFFQHIHEHHTAYQIQVLWVRVTNFSTIQKRVKKRAAETGREVDSVILRTVWEKIPQSIEALRPYADSYVEIMNDEV